MRSFGNIEIDGPFLRPYNSAFKISGGLTTKIKVVLDDGNEEATYDSDREQDIFRFFKHTASKTTGASPKINQMNQLPIHLSGGGSIKISIQIFLEWHVIYLLFLQCHPSVKGFLAELVTLLLQEGVT